MDKQIAIFGGCSNAGKTTLISELSGRYLLEHAKKFDLVKKEATKRGISDQEIFKKFLELELAAIRSITFSDYSRPFLLDSHYAIQPQIDDNLARGVAPVKRVEEPYILSFGQDTIRELAERSKVSLFYIYTDLADILNRRKSNMRNYYIPQRSLDPSNISDEIEKEYEMFLKMHQILRDLGADVKRHEINNRRGELEKRVREIAVILNLGAGKS